MSKYKREGRGHQELAALLIALERMLRAAGHKSVDSALLAKMIANENSFDLLPTLVRTLGLRFSSTRERLSDMCLFLNDFDDYSGLELFKDVGMLERHIKKEYFQQFSKEELDGAASEVDEIYRLVFDEHRLTTTEAMVIGDGRPMPSLIVHSDTIKAHAVSAALRISTFGTKRRWAGEGRDQDGKWSEAEGRDRAGAKAMAGEAGSGERNSAATEATAGATATGAASAAAATAAAGARAGGGLGRRARLGR